jgi:uncharacterized PurR-regulated membrane protein YhhQ (DUF165 family)
VAPAQAPSLTPQGFPLAIDPSLSAIGGRPAIAFDGTNYFVAWVRASGVVAGSRVTTTGVLLDPNGITLGPGTGSPSVAFDGANFLAVWEYGGEVWGARVTPAGAVLDNPALALTSGAGSQTRPLGLAFGDSTFLVAWRDGTSDLWAARISRSGANLDGPKGVRFGHGFYPWIAFDGTNFLVVWHAHGNGIPDDYGFTDLDIFGNRISQDGTPLDGNGMALFAGSGDQDHASVAFDGTNYLVAWHDFRGGGYDGNGTAWVVRVSPGGAVLDDPAIQIADNVGAQAPPVAAFDGTNFIVAWQVSMTQAKWRLSDTFGRRIAGSGAWVDPLPIPLATASAQQYEPTIGAGGNAYLVAWNELLSGGRCPDGCVYAQVFGPGATLPVPAPGAAAPVDGGWHLVDSPTAEPLYAIWGIDASHAYAVGEGSVLVRYDGTAWQLVDDPGGRLFGVWGAPDGELWAIGWCWGAFRYNGLSWAAQGCQGIGGSPDPFSIGFGIWGTSGTNMLTVGAEGGFTRYDGFGWSHGSTGARWTLWDVWGTSPTNAYAVGELGTVRRYNGTAWSAVPGIPTVQSLNSIWGSGESDIFAVGDFGTIVHYDGATWTLQPSGTTQHLFGVWGYGASHLYAVGFNGTILRYDGTTWQAEMSGTGAHLLAVGGAGGNVWAVGDGGTILAKSVLALSLSASGRRDSLPIGSAPHADSAAVQINGPGSTGTGWSATHRSAATWVSLTTSAGTGSGMLRWTRDPSGLTVGTYVDTIVITVAGAVGSPAQLVDSLVVEPALTLALSPGSRSDSVALGTSGPRADSASVTLSGFGSALAGWSATHRDAATWVSLTTSAGTGSGRVRWTRDPSGLAVGTYVDTIVAAAAGASGSPTRLLDTLIVDPALALALSLGSRRDSAALGTSGPRADSASVTLSGFGSTASPWSATHRAAATWVSLTTGAGTGSGQLRWTRDPSGLAVDTYVDTILVTAAGATGSPTRLVDTLLVDPALELALSPGSRRDSAAQGTSGPRADSASVTLGGFGSTASPWSATHRAAATWVTLTTSAGTGTGRLRWTRNPAGLTVGTYVDTIVVAAAGAAASPARLVDTLSVEPVLALALSPGSRRDSVVQGASAPRADSATATLSGFGSAASPWSATHRAAATWVALTTSAGTATGRMRWTRNPTDLTVGTYVDTIVVTAAGASGSPARLVDTLVVAQRLTLAVGTAVRRDTTFAGLSGTRADSGTVTLTGDGAASAPWAVTHRSAAAWVSLTTSAGTGSGMARWTRSYGGLAQGTYVDSIVVTAAGATGSPAVVLDSLVVRPPPVAAPAVADAILEGGALTPEQIAYLDRLGNANGSFDLGDFLAWVLKHPDQSAVAAPARDTLPAGAGVGSATPARSGRRRRMTRPPTLAPVDFVT